VKKNIPNASGTKRQEKTKKSAGKKTTLLLITNILVLSGSAAFLNTLPAKQNERNK